MEHSNSSFRWCTGRAFLFNLARQQEGSGAESGEETFVGGGLPERNSTEGQGTSGMVRDRDEGHSYGCFICSRGQESVLHVFFMTLGIVLYSE